MSQSLLPRHIPPTATPLTFTEWQQGANAPASANEEFAAALAAYLGVRHLFLASSGRAALRLLLDTLALQPALAGRQEVVLPGYTCPALAKVVLDAGLTPQLVDLDPDTFTYPPAALAAAVSEDTLAVMVVHPFGIPVALGPALAAARAAGALVIEDAAQAMGARVDGVQVGTRGHVGLYSLGPGKPLALGGGGVVATGDDALAAALAKSWSALAVPAGLSASWAWLRMGLFSLAFQPPLWWLATRLGAQKVGGNEASWGYRLTGFAPSQAAVGLALLPKLDAINQHRRDHARLLLAGLADLKELTSPGLRGSKFTENTKQAIYLRLPLLTRTPAQADALFAALSAAGIGVGRVYGRTLPEFFPQLASPPLPGSERVARTLLTLPTNYHTSAADLAHIPEVVRAALASMDT
ncbi:MAG: DegT/DnrJ/EryC1/StrS family aminotransferase [Caldilineaceae bacterium]|nr:DegT/DnrJ/EryC1/StrS family aminotransferase [Caldilineaceae bacterium]